MNELEQYKKRLIDFLNNEIDYRRKTIAWDKKYAHTCTCKEHIDEAIKANLSIERDSTRIKTYEYLIAHIACDNI